MCVYISFSTHFSQHLKYLQCSGPHNKMTILQECLLTTECSIRAVKQSSLQCLCKYNSSSHLFEHFTIYTTAIGEDLLLKHDNNLLNFLLMVCYDEVTTELIGNRAIALFILFPAISWAARTIIYICWTLYMTVISAHREIPIQSGPWFTSLNSV